MELALHGQRLRLVVGAVIVRHVLKDFVDAVLGLPANNFSHECGANHKKVATCTPACDLPRPTPPARHPRSVKEHVQ